MENSATRPARKVRQPEASLRWRAPQRLRLSLAGGAVLVSLAVVGVVMALAPDTAGQLFTDLRTGAFGGDQFVMVGPFAALLLGLAIGSGLAIYHLGRIIILVRGWQQYLFGLTRELSDYVTRHARLSALGYVPLGAAQAGSPATSTTAADATMPATAAVAGLLQATARFVLTGDHGGGKSIAVLRQALDIARSAQISRMITGRQLIPLVLPFAVYAAAAPSPEGLRVSLLVAEVNRFGARMLAERLPILLRRGRVALLLDGMDEVPPAAAAAVLEELERGVRGVYRNVRIGLTCRTAAFAGLAASSALLRFTTQIALLPLAGEETQQIIRRAGRSGMLGTRSPDAVLTQIAQHDLDAILRNPALLAMLLEIVEAGEPIPSTRAQLIAAYEAVLFARNRVAPEAIVPTQQLLGQLAVSLHAEGAAVLAGVPPWDAALAASAVLASQATVVASIGRPTYQESDVSLAESVAVALRAGVLERDPTGLSLHFRAMALLNLAAARHLDTHDAGLGRIPPLLLRPEWLEMVILWGGLTADPLGLADRLSRMAATARPGTGRPIEPLFHALALAVAVVSLTPMVVSPPAERAVQAQIDIAQQHLLDLFDHVLRYGLDDQQPEQRLRLRGALRDCEDAMGGELTSTLARLVRSSQAHRIMRAQAVQVLGFLASPAALAALTTLLLEPDPTVREALSRGFHLAGAEAADPLLDLIATNASGEVIHRRALDAITAVDGPAVAPALERLQRTSPTMRAAAAEALGALRDRRALEPLLEASKDPAANVQLAAIRALGRLGDQKAQTTLLPLLQTPAEEVLIAAAEALGLLRIDRAIKPLIKLLDDEHPRVRAAAAEALGHLGDVRAIDALRQRLSDKDGWAQAAAATALRALGQRD